MLLIFNHLSFKYVLAKFVDLMNYRCLMLLLVKVAGDLNDKYKQHVPDFESWNVLLLMIQSSDAFCIVKHFY